MEIGMFMWEMEVCRSGDLKWNIMGESRKWHQEVEAGRDYRK